MKRILLFSGLILLLGCSKEQQPDIGTNNNTNQNGSIDTLSGVYHIMAVTVYNYPTPQPNDTQLNYTAYITYTSQDSVISAVILDGVADTFDRLNSITAYQTIDSGSFFEIRYSEDMCTHGEIRYFPQADSISCAFRIDACGWGLNRYYYGTKQ